MARSEIPPQLDRFLAGESTPEEAAAMRRWAEEDPRNAALIEVLSAREPAGASWNVDAAWARVAASMQRPALPFASRRRSLVNLPASLRVAAVLLLLVGAGYLASELGLSRRETADAVAIELSTGRGEQRTVRLPDGTEVHLGVDSRLRVEPGFPEARVVHLAGEAFFQVAHLQGSGFQVIGGGTVTRVLGTGFAVRALEGEPVRVVVANGRVHLGIGESGAELTAGQVGTAGSDGRVVVEEAAAIEALLAWRSGWIRFENATLAEVLRELERWHPEELEIADPRLRSRRITTAFRGETIEQIAEALSAAVGVEWVRSGDTIRFGPAAAH